MTPSLTTPPFAWSSIVAGARNYGNMLIEHCLLQALDLGRPAITFDSFRPMDDQLAGRINRECSMLISPGCTTLQAGQNPAYDSFDRIALPKPCFGGCLWPTGKPSRLSVIARALLPPPRGPRPLPASAGVDLSIARKHTQPIGSRDTFTHQSLQAAGIESWYIGCPTLLSPKPIERCRTPAGRSAVVSLSRWSVPRQWRMVRRLARRWHVSLLIHEPYERKLAKMLGRVEVVEYESPRQFMDLYAQADLVVTGRLHGALPAVRAGTPVLFYGDPADTRFSLLSHIGLPIRRLTADLGDMGETDDARPGQALYERVYALREKFVAYARHYNIATRLTM